MKFLQKENLFTFFVIDKDGPGGIKSKINLSNSKTSINISDRWLYKKLLEMELLITVKNFDNKNSFYDESEFSFYNLQGVKLNFDNLLIKEQMRIVNTVLSGFYGVKIKRITPYKKNIDENQVWYKLSDSNMWETIPREIKLEPINLERNEDKENQYNEPSFLKYMEHGFDDEDD